MNGQDCGQLRLFPADFPVSLFPLPGSEEARRMTAISGRRCCELLKNSGPLGSLAKTLLASSAWSSPARLLEWRAEALTASRTRTIMRRYCHNRRTCCSSHSSETLSVSDTKSRHLLYRLVPLAPATGGTGSHLWPTVTSDSASDRSGRYAQGGLPLTAAVKMWPTPTVADTFTSGMKSSQQKPGSMHSVNLTDAVRMWPTPKASDYKGSGLAGSKSAEHDKQRRNLKGYVMYPTPKAQNALGGGQKHGSGGPSLDVVAGGKLNPDWVEWLQAFPPGWTDIG